MEKELFDKLLISAQEIADIERGKKKSESVTLLFDIACFSPMQCVKGINGDRHFSVPTVCRFFVVSLVLDNVC